MTSESGSRGARLFIVRHGETVGQSSIRYHGRSDVALSEAGREQMRCARAAIASMSGSARFVRVFSSPLIRAYEGAQIVAGEASPIITIDGFTEVHFGLFEGLTAEEIRDRHPEEFARWNVDRLAADYTYPEGESRAAFAERVERGADQMLAAWTPLTGDALLVAHRGVIRAVVRKLCGEQPTVELGSIQALRFDGAWRVIALDCTDHLADL